MDYCLYSRTVTFNFYPICNIMCTEVYSNDFNKETKTGAYSFQTSSVSIAVVIFLNAYYTLCYKKIVSLHFHTVILFTLFCGLTFQHRSSAKKNLSCNDFKQKKKD